MRTRFYMFICIPLMGCLLAGCNEDVKKDALEKYIYVNKSSLDMFIGDEVQLMASPVGENFVWSSENPEVVSVSRTGLAKALTEGTSAIAVNDELKVEIRVREFIPLTDISLTAMDINLMAKLTPGSTLQFRAEPLPSNTTAEFSPVWTSSNTGVATVSKKGLLTAHAAGTTALTVTSGDISKSLEITVIPAMSEEGLFRDAKAYWKFDDPSNITKASIGQPLETAGTGFTAVGGPSAGNGAVQVAKGSYFRAPHGMAANGGGSRVNSYTVMFDFKVSELGRYYSFIQTTLENNDDAEFFLRPAGHLGIGGTGYSEHVVTAGEWHRLVISAAMGNAYLYYLDGELIHTGNIENATVDSRWSWLPGGVLFFADEDGEDAEIDIAEVTVWDGALSAEDISALGKTPSSPAGEQLVGMWTFEDSNNLGRATTGNDLEASGSFTPIDGPGNTGAVKPASNAYYTIRHSIGANGGGSRVNEYTLMMDVRGSAAEFAGWLSVFNNQNDNSGEGVLWINGGGNIGYAALGGYSSSGLTPDTWHRVVIAAKLGESFRIYIDGEHVFSASSNTDADGKMSLHPDVVYIGADGTGYPGPSLADVRMWSIQLTDEQVRTLGKP